MNDKQAFWCILQSAILPVARRAHADLSGPPAGPGDQPDEAKATIAGTLEQAIAKTKDSEPPPDEVGGGAFWRDFDAISRQTRKKVSWMFHLNFALAVGLAALFLVGIGGAVLTAIAARENIWPVVFEGASAVSFVTLLVTNPQKRVWAAIRISNAFDTLSLEYRTRIQKCTLSGTIGNKLQCCANEYKLFREDANSLFV